MAALVATAAGTFAAIGLYHMKTAWQGRSAVSNLPVINAELHGVYPLPCFSFSLGSLLKFERASHAAHRPYTFNIPYVILSVMPKLRQLDKNLVDAAQDLGCTRFLAFRKVVVPEIMPGIINGLIISFTMSVDDFVISYFTAGSHVQTLSMTIYSMTRKRISPKINAVSASDRGCPRQAADRQFPGIPAGGPHEKAAPAKT